jgi:hypothetical protein
MRQVIGLLRIALFLFSLGICIHAQTDSGQQTEMPPSPTYRFQVENPSQITFGEEAIVTCRLEVSEGGGGLRLGKTVKAQLIASPNISVSTISREVQDVTNSEGWRWKISPRKPGNYELSLIFSSDERVVVPSFIRIEVKPTFFYWFTQATLPVLTIVALMSLITGFFLRSRASRFRTRADVLSRIAESVLNVEVEGQTTKKGNT